MCAELCSWSLIPDFLFPSNVIFSYFSVQGKYEGGERFTYTQALVFFMCAANTIFAYALMGKKVKDTVPLPNYAFCAASYLGAMICSNQALQYLPYPTQVRSLAFSPSVP